MLGSDTFLIDKKKIKGAATFEQFYRLKTFHDLPFLDGKAYASSAKQLTDESSPKTFPGFER